MIDVPVPIKVPPQLFRYHFHVAPLPNDPPATESVMFSPMHMLLNGLLEIRLSAATDEESRVTTKLAEDELP